MKRLVLAIFVVAAMLGFGWIGSASADNPKPTPTLTPTPAPVLTPTSEVSSVAGQKPLKPGSVTLTANPGKPARTIRTYRLPNGEQVTEETTVTVINGSVANSTAGSGLLTASAVSSSYASASCTARKRIWSTLHLTLMLDASWTQRWRYYRPWGAITSLYPPEQPIVGTTWPYAVRWIGTPYNYWLSKNWQARTRGSAGIAYSIAGADLTTGTISATITVGPWNGCSARVDVY